MIRAKRTFTTCIDSPATRRRWVNDKKPWSVKTLPPNAPGARGAEGHSQHLIPTQENNSHGLEARRHNSNEITTSKYQSSRTLVSQYHANGLWMWACCRTLGQGCRGWDYSSANGDFRQDHASHYIGLFLQFWICSRLKPSFY